MSFNGEPLQVAELRHRAANLSRLAGITHITIAGARGIGVRALELRNGSGLSATIVADRALDALELNFRGIPLTWLGPGALASPQSCPATLEDFERSFFGGLVTTCGLTAFGPPGSDAWGSWPQHGRVNFLPAELLETCVTWNEAKPEIRVAGTIREARMFGENMRFERTWTMPIGGSELVLHDRVTNDGGRTEPHMLLYHCNAGYPLVDRDTVWSVSHVDVVARDDEAEKAIDVWERGGPPDAGFKEQVFVHRPLADQDGWAHATATNPALLGGLSLRVAYRPEQLPALFTWRMLSYGTYVMAAEPANCQTIAGRVQAYNDGTLPLLEPGETRNYDLRFSVSCRHR